MDFGLNELTRSIDESNAESDRILKTIDDEMDALNTFHNRELILDIVESNINENGTVSVYDIARINEIAPESGLRNLGPDEKVAAALNAIGSNKAGIFRLIIGLLMGVAGIGMMVYGFVQQNKDRQATIDSIRASSDAIKKNALQFKTATISLNDKPLINDEVIGIYGKIKELWVQIVGPDSKPLDATPSDFIKNPVYPITQKTKEINKIIQTKIWRGEVDDVKRLNAAVASLTSDLSATSNKVEKWFDAFLEHMTKGNPLPSQFPDFLEALYIKDPFTGKQSYPGGILEGFLTATQTAWPHRYPESSLTKAAQSDLTSVKTAYSMDLILKGGSANIADACAYAMDMGSNSAENIKRISELSTKIASRLKIAEDKAKHSLEKLEGMDRGDYKVHLTKVRGQLSDFNKLNEAIDRAIINGIAVGKQTDKFLKQLKAYDDLVSSMRYKAYKAAGEKKAAGNNGYTFGLNSVDGESTWLEDTLSQPAPTPDDNAGDPTDVANAFDEVALDQYLDNAELEISSIEKLAEIADRLDESGTISRADVAEIEAAAPGLLSYMEDQPNFTFRPSTIGLEPALNAIGDRITAKGGILAAIIAAIIAVIGYIISKIFGGSKGAGKEVGGIQTPSAEVVEINQKAKASAEKTVAAVRFSWEAKAQQRRDESERKLREQRARAAEAATKQAAEELKRVEAEEKKRQAEWDRHQREQRITSPESLRYGEVNDARNLNYIYSVDKSDAHLPEKVIAAYNDLVRLMLRNGSIELPYIKDLCLSWLIAKQPSILSFYSPSSVNEYYNTFVFAPDALARVKRACGLCDGVGERILEISDMAHDAHRKAITFWNKQPRKFRSMSDFNQAMADTGFGEALAKVKERSTQLDADTKAITPVRSELKYNFIDVTNPENLMAADPIPTGLSSLSAEYGKESLPASIFKFRDSMGKISKLMDEEKRHQGYNGGMRKNGGFYLADNVYGSAGITGKGTGRGVNLALRKELMGDGMPAEVFAAIARVEREQVDFINQAHRKIQGAVNSTAYVVGDLRRYYESAVNLSRNNVVYQEKLATLIKTFSDKE